MCHLFFWQQAMIFLFSQGLKILIVELEFRNECFPLLNTACLATSFCASHNDPIDHHRSIKGWVYHFLPHAYQSLPILPRQLCRLKLCVGRKGGSKSILVSHPTATVLLPAFFIWCRCVVPFVVTSLWHSFANEVVEAKSLTKIRSSKP